MTTYTEFKETLLRFRIDKERFLYCTKIKKEIIEQARVTNKLPNFVALSLMSYIDNIEAYQPKNVVFETLLAEAQRLGLEIDKGIVIVKPFEIKHNFSIPSSCVERVRFVR
jgi:hypothetical protein